MLDEDVEKCFKKPKTDYDPMLVEEVYNSQSS